MTETYSWLTEKRRKIMTVLELPDLKSVISYFPRRYTDLTPGIITPERHDTRVVVRGVVRSKSALIHIHRQLTKFTVEVESQGDVFRGILFNRQFIYKALITGKEIIIAGKLNFWKHEISVQDILTTLPEKTEWIRPVYKLPNSIGQAEIRNLISRAMSVCRSQILDFVPASLMEKYGFPSRVNCFEQLHYPTDQTSLQTAINYFKYEEFLLYSFTMLEQRKAQQGQRKNRKKIESRDRLNQMINEFPFPLTSDQHLVIEDILANLQSPQMMYRLLQGDVGTGKTVVALVTLVANYLAGYQGAFMAPTELLARQHYETFRTLLRDRLPIRLTLLTSALDTHEKSLRQSQIREGAIDIVIGTHALIQEKVQFPRLGLAVVDEQHRFGVQQRQILRQKGEEVDLLMMSATPIPRTLAMTLYGDMDISTLTVFPSKKRQITTKLVPQNTAKPILNQLNSILAGQGKVYVICPLIEDNGSQTRDVQSIYEGLKSYYHGHYEVGLLHGRLTDDEKQTVMNQFKHGAIHILVSTTVVEVGVDVKEANAMLIYNSERFGLSQLHQLRGRIGRQGQPSFCFLLTEEVDPSSLERLKMLEKEEDGFALARFDLEHRGPGDLLGVRQSGLPEFHFGNLMTDLHWLDLAQKDANHIYHHPNEPEFAHFLSEVRDYQSKRIAVIA